MGDGFNLSDLLPEDAPPWLVALFGILAFLIATVSLWGPWVKSKLSPTTAVAIPPPDDAEDDGDTTPVQLPADKIDAQMLLIDRMFKAAQEDQVKLEAENEELSDALQETKTKLQAAEFIQQRMSEEIIGYRATIASLNTTIERLMAERGYPYGGPQGIVPPPPDPQAGPDGTGTSRHRAP